jgi:hypothetical protein
MTLSQETLVNPTRLIAIALLAAPAVAAAQSSYSQARILPAPEIVVYPAYSGRDCDAARIHFSNRGAALEHERRDYETEAGAIAREGASLNRELQGLDTSNAGAVSAYNARSEAHNRRVDDHNARVASMNSAAATMNAELAEADSQCALPPLTPLERIR